MEYRVTNIRDWITNVQYNYSITEADEEENTNVCQINKNVSSDKDLLNHL